MLLLGRLASKAQSVTVTYQPTTYSIKKSNGTAMSEDASVVHLWNGWLSSVYNKNMLVRDEKLQIGGWGDTYVSLLKFDLEGLPRDVDMAQLGLYARDAKSINPSQMSIRRNASSWSPSSVNWSKLPSTDRNILVWPVSTTKNVWRNYQITSWYNDWQSGKYPNNGLTLWPYGNTKGQRFDRFSSSYIQAPTEAELISARPLLRLKFIPTLQLKMPLPGNVSWLVTTEVGGYDCKGDYDVYHDDNNYFSIDFSWRSRDVKGNLAYKNPDPDNNPRTDDKVFIPVIAAAGGVVIEAGMTQANGNYVVIDHDGDKKVHTGFQTRYLHLQNPGPVVRKNQVVKQGDLLGYMGNTGLSTGAHLHFGVRFRNSGESSIPELSKVVMDGWLLKSFQTECSVNSKTGIPLDWNRFYKSSNRVY